MRQLTLIFLLSLLNSSPAEPPKREAPIKLDPFIKKIENSLKAYVNKGTDTQELLKTIGISGIYNASQSTALVGDTWLSSIHINRKPHGLFELLGKTRELPFIAPESADIVIQASLDLRKAPFLLRQIHHINGTAQVAETQLSTTVAGIPLESLLQTSQPTFHLCIDFDEKEKLFLGKESIGRPHFLIRIDGMQPELEACLSHFIKTRNALFTKHLTANGTIYTLPNYFSEAFAGYQPIIKFDSSHNTTTIASSPEMLERLKKNHPALSEDPSFIQTWDQLPKESTVKAYISKRALSGLHSFYLLALKEKWTNNPIFEQKKLLISGAVSQLNSSESGLAFALSSDENRDIITLKIPFPSSMLLWILGQ